LLPLSEIRTLPAREAGKGNNPLAWTGDYFTEVSSVKWYQARAGDVVFSAIDLWKGCIAVVPPEFDGGLVSKDFPIYRIIDPRLTPEFLHALLRSRYYQRAFRAITTGHSNRRRTQEQDFQNLMIVFPPDPEVQSGLIEQIIDAKSRQYIANSALSKSLMEFSNLIDGRGEEQLPELDEDGEGE
jgi:type I restriction enzyme M protein